MAKIKRCFLKYRLSEVNMKQQSLAERLSMPKSMISEYANGHTIMSLETAKTIADAIGCNVEDLYEWE